MALALRESDTRAHAQNTVETRLRELSRLEHLVTKLLECVLETHQLVLDAQLRETDIVLGVEFVPLRILLTPAELSRKLSAENAKLVRDGLVGEFGIDSWLAGNLLKSLDDICHWQIVGDAHRVLAEGLLLGVEQALHHNAKVVVQVAGNGEQSGRLAWLGPDVPSVRLMARQYQ